MVPLDPAPPESIAPGPAWKSLEKIRVVKEEPAAVKKSAPPQGHMHRAPKPDEGRLEPYRAYKPRPFTREERKDVTVLFGGLHWRAERLIQGSMEGLGYNAVVLPTATREDLLKGREVADIGQCCPTSFTVGNLANYLKDKAGEIGVDEVNRKYVYMTAGSCGACRFGQYHQSYELALRNVGLEQFRMFLLGQDGLDQGPAAGGGLDLNLPFTLGAVWAIVLSDIVQDMEYQTRPYEVNPGETDRVTRECVEYLHEVFRNRPVRGKKWGAVLWHFGTDYFVRAMREVKKRYDAIEVDRLRVKPLVKITGEFYLQTVEGAPNYNIHSWLESEGAEVYPASVTIWLDYLLRLAGQEFEDHIGITPGSRFKLNAIRSLQGLLVWTYNRMRHAMADVPHEMPDQYELRELAAPYYHSRLNGGEGDMLVGKALWAYHHKKAHMICELSPYSCMPNTMSIGAMAAVIGKYPDLLYAPLEIKGDAEVHALSRCQMILTEAKKRAQKEFQQTLAATGLSEEQLRGRLASHSSLRRATTPVPRTGAAAGTAANLALALAGAAVKAAA
jgi:predicted nucleotide-binding protein (sugar kinase/HSP70/actin superfamily)